MASLRKNNLARTGVAPDKPQEFTIQLSRRIVNVSRMNFSPCPRSLFLFEVALAFNAYNTFILTIQAVTYSPTVMLFKHQTFSAWPNNWKERPRPLEQLYDLIFDPNEASNTANDLSVAVVLEEMRTRLDNWMSSTNDPLLRGPVPAPPGAELNDQDQMSASDPTRFV